MWTCCGFQMTGLRDSGLNEWASLILVHRPQTTEEVTSEPMRSPSLTAVYSGGRRAARRARCYLQLLDGLTALADDQPRLAGWDHHLLHGATLAVGRFVEGRGGRAPPPRHDLVQEHLGLPAGRAKTVGKGSEAAERERGRGRQRGTYSMASGEPVSATLLSGRPPLSGNRRERLAACQHATAQQREPLSRKRTTAP